MVKRALLIGCNYSGYKGLELRGCIADAKNVRDYLLAKQGFAEQDIRLLTDETAVKPKRKHILDGLQWLIAGAQPGDSLYLHFSGHGSQVTDLNGDESDGLDETIVPLDYQTAGQITDDELRAVADKIPEGVRCTWVIDACHSATVVDLPYNFEDNSTYAKSGKPSSYVSSDWNTRITSIKNQGYKETRASLLVISGCQDKFTSADTVEDGKSQGAMTYSLLKTLKNAEQRGKTEITIERLLKDMSCLLRVKKYTQKPNVSSGQKISLTDAFTI